LRYYTNSKKPRKKLKQQARKKCLSMLGYCHITSVKRIPVKARHHFLFLFIIVCLIISLLFSDVLLSAELRKAIFRFPKIDTIGHFITFFSLTWVVHSIIKIPLKITILTLTFYAGLSELGQAYLGFRTGELTDFLADVVGILFFASLKWLFQLWRNKQDKSLITSKENLS
jgi:VanZ family protein